MTYFPSPMLATVSGMK